jgi:heme/copper-type cytochrome/quinol oxidase subunit 2
MKKLARLLFVLVLAAFAAPTWAASPAPGKVIDVTATADQHFSPDHLVLKVNEPRPIRFTSAGGVHGIESKDLGIPATMIMPDKPVSFAIRPKQVGTYKLPCTIVCGANHASMLLTIDVTS